MKDPNSFEITIFGMKFAGTGSLGIAACWTMGIVILAVVLISAVNGIVFPFLSR